MGMPQAKEVKAELNGIDLAAFSKIPEIFTEAPEQAVVRFETRTHWLGGVRCRSEVRAFEMGGTRIEREFAIESDEPPQIMGQDTAPNPQELFLSAIGSCLAAIYALHATAMGIELLSLDVDLEGTIDLRGSLQLADVPNGFPELSCRVHVAADAAPDVIQALHEKALATSPNYYHLTRAIPARAQLVIRD